MKKALILIEQEEPHTPLAYFIGENECYSEQDGHAPCAKEYADGCKEATARQRSEFRKKLTAIGYNDLIVTTRKAIK
jgi:hypothetical protein